MKITWNELTIPPADYADADLLAHWRWLLAEDFQVILVSTMGDLFLADRAERIHWLDAGAGRLTEIAESVEEFNRLRQQVANANEWFLPQLVGDLMESGMRLDEGQCFGYKLPPALGGQMELANFEPTDLRIHFGILGQVHEQIKDLPEGTPIEKFEFEP